jgi:hypothetical protein
LPVEEFHHIEIPVAFNSVFIQVNNGRTDKTLERFATWKCCFGVSPSFIFSIHLFDNFHRSNRFPISLRKSTIITDVKHKQLNSIYGLMKSHNDSIKADYGLQIYTLVKGTPYIFPYQAKADFPLARKLQQERYCRKITVDNDRARVFLDLPVPVRIPAGPG